MKWLTRALLLLYFTATFQGYYRREESKIAVTIALLGYIFLFLLTEGVI